MKLDEDIHQLTITFLGDAHEGHCSCGHRVLQATSAVFCAEAWFKYHQEQRKKNHVLVGLNFEHLPFAAGISGYRSRCSCQTFMGRHTTETQALKRWAEHWQSVQEVGHEA